MTALTIQDALSMLKSGAQIVIPNIPFEHSMEVKAFLIRTLEEHERVMKDAQWRPIETAPKDSNNLLAYDEDSVVHMVSWSMGEHGYMDFYSSEGWKPRLKGWKPLPAIDAQITKEQA